MVNSCETDEPAVAGANADEESALPEFFPEQPAASANDAAATILTT
jgi:hypothetical protein